MKGHFEKVCLKSKHSTHSLKVPQASTSSTGAGDPLYFDDNYQPVFAHMISVLHSNKHLIKFPIALDYSELKIGKEEQDGKFHRLYWAFQAVNHTTKSRYRG